MSPWRNRFAGPRLEARFRSAALLMLMPLLGLAGVSATGLVVSSNASSALDSAEQLTAQVTLLNQHVQGFSLTAFDVLVGRGANNLRAMSAAELQVNADLAALARAPNLTPDQVNELPAINAAWQATLSYRVAARRVGSAAVSNPVAAAELEDFLYADLTTVTDRLSTLEASGAAHIAGLRAERDAAVRASAVAVVIALVLGLGIAAWVSRRLGLSVLRSLATLKTATSQLASGDLRHRVGPGNGDEIADLGAAFDTMAGQLAEQRDAVRTRERRLEALVENASDGILVIDAEGKVLFTTPSFRDYVGNDEGAVTGITPATHPDDLARVSAAWNRAASGADGSTLEVEARLKHRDGSWRHVWAKLTNRFGDPAVAGMVINISDVSERHEYEQQLTFQALHDALTGLANRELFRQRLERSADTTGVRRVNSVLYLDFDDFKRINDTQGHQAGDDFLVAMAERLIAVVRPVDTVARLGGDEFAVLLERTDTRSAVAATKRVLTALHRPFVLGGKEVSPRASVGIASAAAGTASPETLLADADLAMYFAKRQGKAQYRVFSAAMRTDLLDRLQLGEDLRAAVEAGAIEVNYQPIVDMESGSIVGAEALARWNHSSRGWVGPAVFIPLAEELNLAGRIDALVLHQACTQGRAWTDAGLPAIRMAVNLSGSNLDKPDLVATVARTLQETGFPAANLELELTEGVVIAESASALATLENLKALGLHLAIDDFGTGYSALSRLRALPFDTLKVDKVFVDELGAAHAGSTLAESILDMARVLGLKVVAEGVETSSQAEFLRRRGCDFAQGYLFSRAIEASAFAGLLVAGGSLDAINNEAAIA
jgi:diguanylate cyclase (GGDEF)-like protein/PAS domain S-box-containing protein